VDIMPIGRQASRAYDGTHPSRVQRRRGGRDRAARHLGHRPLTAIVIGGVAIVIYGPQTEGRLDGVGIDAFRPRPVEVGHRLEATEAGTGEAALEPAITPAIASGTCLWLAREVGALAH